jgi:hypothetical protein
MDNEFGKIKDHVPMLGLNIAVATDHVGEVEQQI